MEADGTVDAVNVDPQYPQPQPTPAPAPAPTVPPLRNSESIQGNVLAAFNKNLMTYWLVSFGPDIDQARSWLGSLLVTLEESSTRRVEDWNAAFSLAKAANQGVDPPTMTATWTNLGLTFQGLTKLADNAILTTGLSPYPAFQTGPADPTRASALGDTDSSAPAQWKFGGPSNPAVDAIVTVAADVEADLANRLQQLQREAADFGVVTVTTLAGATLPGPLTGHEHFGFKDGISQPGVLDFHPPDPTGTFRDGHPGQPLVPPGEFVLGYPRADGSQDGTAWLRDSSFQVLRQLQQDVPGWWGQTSGEALVAGTSLDGSAAELVGRRRDGTALATPNDGPNGNNFDYSDDPTGTTTPCLAHIRKTNPRSDFGQSHRIMRRGIPYGAPFDLSAPAELTSSRGLLFNAYCADLFRQFEFLQQQWANNPAFPPGQATGPDPVISPGGVGSLSGRQVTFARFVTTLGGLYALCLSLPTLALLAEGLPLSGP